MSDVKDKEKTSEKKVNFHSSLLLTLYIDLKYKNYRFTNEIYYHSY